MSIRKKLDMSPREAAYVAVLNLLQNALADTDFIEASFYKPLADFELRQIWRHVANLHNDLADEAHSLYGLDSPRL